MNLKTLLRCSMVFGLVIISTIAQCDMAGNMALAKMARPQLHPHKISDVIAFYSKKDQNRDIRDLALIAKDIFEIEELNVPSAEIAQISDWNIFDAIKAKMSSQDLWKKKLPIEKTKMLESNKNLLSKNFKITSIEWAWVLFQQGEKAEAKKILLSRFEDEYASVMRLKMAHFGFGRGPMSGMEEAYKGLDSLCDDKEKAPLKEKISKAKVYVSNLPNANIMT